jgi:exosortase
VSCGIATRPRDRLLTPALLPWIFTVAAFAALFAKPLAGMFSQWLSDADAGHGLLLAPLALFLAWRTGIDREARPQRVLGAGLIVASVVLRFLAELAAELFTMRLSILGAAFGLTVYFFGVRQLLKWWLPAVLLMLSVPLPEVVTGTLALPLQFRASALGAAMLELRHVPVRLDGNIIRIPGHTLFVTEACSGLRSLSALLALGFLIGGLWLRSVPGRVFLVLAALPIAVLLNGFRIFLTGFAMHYIDPALGNGLMHYTEGWVMFLFAFAILGLVAWFVTWGEAWWQRPRAA